MLLVLVGLWAGGAFKGKAEPPGPKEGETPVAAGPAEFVPLFNGKDLTGWETLPPKRIPWAVADGVLHGDGGGMPRGSLLMTTRATYGDFELELRAVHLDYDPAALYVRYQLTGMGMRGYRITLGGFEGKDKGKRPVTLGSVRREMPGEKDAPGKYDLKVPKTGVKRNDPFTLRVTVRGNKVTTAVNGGPPQTFEDKQDPLPPGQIAVWLSGESALQVRAIAVRELK